VSLKNAALEQQEHMRRFGIGNQKDIRRIEARACEAEEKPAENQPPASGTRMKNDNRTKLAGKVLAELPATQNACTHGLLQGTLSHDCAVEDVRRTLLKKPRS